MKEKLYVHSSNLQAKQLLQESEKFVHSWSYGPFEARSLHPNEWGKIKLQQIDVHFMFGQIQQPYCPWCGTRPEFKKVYARNIEDPLNMLKYAMVCPKCKSQGPVHNISQSIEDKQDEIHSFLYTGYQNHLPWDHWMLKNEGKENDNQPDI